MDDVTWAALTLTLTGLLAVATWFLYQRRGVGAGLKGAALTLLPLAAYLTDTLRMFTRIATAVGDWATGLVFSPTVWIGIVLTGVAGLLYAAGRAIEARRQPRARPSRRSDKLDAAADPPAPAVGSRPAKGGKSDSADDELDEIEALLRKRGIT